MGPELEKMYEQAYQMYLTRKRLTEEQYPFEKFADKILNDEEFCKYIENVYLKEIKEPRTKK